jgi:hypothetical protein
VKHHAARIVLCAVIGIALNACSYSKTADGLQLIGLIYESTSDKRPIVAVFRDSSSAVIYGRAGDLIADRYRIVRFREDAVELADRKDVRVRILLPMTNDQGKER